MAPNLSVNSSKHLASINDPHIPAFALTGGNLAVNGHTILHDVPPNITLTPSTTVCKGSPLPDPTGAFLGFDSPTAASRHIVPLGRLFDIRFSSIFRFKVWWTTHWTGSTGSDLEHETQFLLLDRAPSGRPHVLLLPIIEGPFRASLQPGANCHVDLCLESGSSVVCGSHFTSCVYMHAGDDPYALVRDAMRVVRVYMGGAFKLLEEKSPPGVVDKFGWCTWDAFYLKVGPEGVMEGVRRLADGGCPPGHVLIDDGWQSVCHDRSNPLTCEDPLSSTSAGDQMPCRLVKFEENDKFSRYESPRPGGRKGMGAFISDLKREFDTVEYVYTWHALCGYWGGVRPDVEGMPAARVLTPQLSEGLKRTMEDLAVDKIVGNGIGLVDPERVGELYEGLHSRLESAGIDGVKVDVIHLLEMLCEEYGGRVELAKAYYKALTASLGKHFKGNGVIASMEHCNDFFLLGTEAIALGRVGDDFWCTDPSGDPNGTFWLQGCHMVHCAYNSLWMGNFIQPDWDMFQSTHPCATFHAASRAISGGPIYISDAVGKHDFGLLKSLALPDGTILRCEHYALPTRDCLFEDPLHDGKTMLKIYNLNKFTGVLGAFNCQGGGWSRQDRRNKCAAECSRPVTATVRPADVEWCNGRTPISVTGVQLFAVYLYQGRQLVLLNSDEFINITLDPFNYELFTVAPVKVSLSKPVVRFAPIGLVNMLNTGGAIQSVEYKDEEGFAVEIGVKGAGELKVFSSMMPVVCRVNGQAVGFMYKKKVVDIEVPWSGSSSKLTVVEYIF